MVQLKNFYSKEGFFFDKDNDEIYDGIKGKIYIKENASIVEKLTALNMLARLSYECSAMSINNIAFFKELKDIPQNSIVILVDENADLGEDETSVSIENECLYIVSKNSSSLKTNGKYIYGRMPYIWNVGKDEKHLEEIERLLKTVGITEPKIEKIIISSKYEGIKNVFVNISSMEVEVSALNDSIKELEELDMVQTVTLTVDQRKYEINNKNFETTSHLTKKENTETVNKTIELSNLFSIKGIYSDSENDLMNNKLDVKIAVDENISDTLVKAVGNIVVRTALDCLELNLDLVETKEEAGQKNIIEITSEDSNSCIHLDESNNKVIIKGNDEGILKLSESLAKQYPYIDINRNLEINDLVTLFNNILSGKSYEGQIVHLENALENNDDIKLYADLAGQELVHKANDKIKEKYPNKNFEILDHKKEEIIWQETYEPEWEVDTFENIFKTEVLPSLKAGDEIEIKGCLSEEKTVRDELTQRLETSIKNSGASLKSSNIFATYKQGFSWITEKVLPELKEGETPDKVVIKFKPFLPEGQKDWLDENGATPQYQGLRDDKDRWLDLPIRFLQELYPVDDIISEELGIHRDSVIFEADDNLKETYEIICSRCGKEIYKDTGVTRVSERPYLNEFPEHGKVHPTTGWITVAVNGEVIVDKQIKTDLENIWDFYQEKVLNKAKNYVLEKGNGKVLLETQPFFTELRMEVSLSDIDYKLPVRNDLISSLDGFHEDIYFVGQDFFKFLGIKYTGESAAQPGLILPVIRKTNNKRPKLVATIKNKIYDEPVLLIHDKVNKVKTASREEIKVSSIEYGKDSVELNIKVNEESFKLLSNYAELANAKVIKDITDESIINITFENKATGEKSTINKNSTKVKNSKKSLDNSKINTENLIGYNDYIKLMDELKDVKGIKSYVGSKSYQGREVHVVEFFDEDLNDLVSRAKFINYKPVCFINSRHHANEISSTNAAFEMIKSLSNDKEFKKYLEKLNIIIIPFENPDGGYIHYELQKDNPEWKLHVARFDSLGKDTTNEWFNFDTIHTEALAFTKTWFKWLPDVVTDNHGVPSHEWDQQFSGYVSPSFKGFWLPRALYYGYFWYITNEEYNKNNVGVSKIIQDKLCDLVNADSEMDMWNRDWANRFEKYAHEWMPKLFPADYYKNLIYYWIPFDLEKNRKYSSHKYPNITCLDWTTEVADETATGDYLGLCARAHIDGCLAAMESMISVNNKAEVRDKEHDGKITLNKKRQRPLHI
ncbi:MAG: M14 family metallopeptidase [Tissierellia bacterium]|nr:M14 family metallopeptidase [Tissierellia bacterium]